MSLFYTSSPVVRQAKSYQKTRLVLLGSPLPVQKIFPAQTKSWAKKIFLGFLNIVIILSFMIGGAIFVPKIVFAFYEPNTIVASTNLTSTALGGDLKNGSNHSSYLPELNPNLPAENWLEIPLIGVRTVLQETADDQVALDQGVWLDPQFGVPGEGKTVVMAAHRFGWKWWWKDEYWKYHSFNLLPETQVGDLVEVTYGQRKFVYEIYLATEGEEITDFGADLILYTCKHLNSPIKYFRYARLLDPTQDSQSL